MQLLNVQGRICATEGNTDPNEVEQLLIALPRGIYIATLPLTNTLPGVRVVAKGTTTHILCNTSPSLPKL